ncbi:MAG: M24 family metallopeptidase [Gemmatimonadota bacterium]
MRGREEGAGDAARPAAGSDAAAEPPRRSPIDRAARLARVGEALARTTARGLALTPGPNLRWLCGVRVEPSERLVLLVIPTGGEPVLLGPAFERDRLAGQAEIPLDVAPWSEREDALAVAARLLRGGEWLLDPLAPFAVAAGLEERGTRLRPAGELCAALRRGKDTAELERLGEAQRLTRETLAGVPRRLAPGITERELVEEILLAFRDAGEPGWALVQFGEGSALPHGEPGARALADNSPVLVDLGAVVDGYHADLTRAWWFGDRPRPRHGEVASAVERAQARAASLARPGVAARELDREARRSLEEDGLAHAFVHRLGHGVGLEIHEPPFLVEGNAAPLAPGDVFTIEPGAYLPGQFGVRHEDVWVLTREGAARL